MNLEKENQETKINRSQIFSNRTMQENIANFMKRHNIGDFINSEKHNSSYHIQQCIRKILTQYSNEMYDYFRLQFDMYLHQLKKKKCTSEIKEIETINIPTTLENNKEERKCFLRRPSAYNIFCNEVRQNPQLGNIKPQICWRNLPEAAKKIYYEKSKHAPPIYSSKKRDYKTAFGYEKAQQLKQMIEEEEKEIPNTMTVKLDPVYIQYVQEKHKRLKEECIDTVKQEENTLHPSHGIKRPYGAKNNTQYIPRSDLLEESSDYSTDTEDSSTDSED